MLATFIQQHREAIIARTRARIAKRLTPRPTEIELQHGVPLFLEQLEARLLTNERGETEIIESATLHGNELLAAGLTVAQVVHDYGDICQAITQHAIEVDARIPTVDFQTLNFCLDVAIAEAVTEYSRRREQMLAGAKTEQLGALAHELRNLLSISTLAFDVVRTGSVGLTGSTGAVIERSLRGMSDLINRSLAEVRLETAIPRHDRVPLAALIEEIEITATLEARSHALAMTVAPPPPGVAIDGDLQLITSVVSNLVQNACKFTKPQGHVAIGTRVTEDRVFIDVADECGGLPPGKQAELFQPFVQRNADRSGLGLGLAICVKGARAMGANLSVRDIPGTGCVFTFDLPRAT